MCYRWQTGDSLCSKKGFDVKSYGTGSVVKLPGTGPNEPNVYEFGTTYEHIYQDLCLKDQQLYPFVLSRMLVQMTAVWK